MPTAAFPEADTRRYCDWWSFDSREIGGCMIGTDFHAPFHSALWCNRMLAVARKYRIRSLIIAGDGLDMAAFSTWGADPELSWNEEMDFAAQWLWTIYHSFERIYWLRGNHEDRLARATNWQLQAGRFVDAILCHHARTIGKRFAFDPDHLRFSNYPHCTLDEDWLVVHPRSYSRIRGRVGNQLAMIRRKHVIAAHSHYANKGFADDGRHVIIDTGGMFDERAIQYRAMSITTHPAWNNGFVAYNGGHAVLYADAPYTDWSEFEREAMEGGK